MQNVSFQQVRGKMRGSFIQNEYIPSVSEKHYGDTVRLMFRRRSHRELSPLVIIKASDLILRLEHQLSPPDIR